MKLIPDFFQDTLGKIEHQLHVLQTEFAAADNVACHAYVMHAELPGVDASQIDISFEQNVLTIRGTKSSSLDAGMDGELRVYAAERVSGSFERSIRLPEFVDGERISAEFNNGVLTVSVPKAQAAQPRRIEIRTDTVKTSNLSEGSSQN